MIFPERKISAKVQIGIAFLLWCYIIYRALFVSITQDEAHSYLLVKTYNWKQALTTTNTHWLNSFFMRLFLYLPGEDSLWKLRVLSILSWVLYSFSAIRLSECFKNQWIGFGFFFVTILNPFLIFYFSLARGYAPACAFILWSLAMAAKRIQNNETTPRQWFSVFWPASVATLANYSALYFFVALVGAYLLYLYGNGKLKAGLVFSANRWSLLVGGTMTVSIGALFLIRFINEIWFPGNTNVIDSLFGSLVKSVSYFDNDLSEYYKKGTGYLLNEEVSGIFKGLGIGIAILSFAALLYFGRLLSKTKKITLGFFALLCCLGIFLANVFAHFVFIAPYLFERAALIFYPPLILGIFCFFEAISNNSLRGKVVKGLIAALVVIFGFNFFKSFSLTRFLDWPVQTNSKECLDYLDVSGSGLTGMNRWHHSVLVNYYRNVFPGKYDFKYELVSDEMQRDSLNTSMLKYDYLLLAPPYNDSALVKNWDIRLNFPASGAIVLKRKTKEN